LGKGVFQEIQSISPPPHLTYTWNISFNIRWNKTIFSRFCWCCWEDFWGEGWREDGDKERGWGGSDERKICSYLGNGIEDEGKITNIKLCSCVLTPHSKQSYITNWIIFFLCFSAFVLHIFVLFHAENFINIISG